MIKVIKQREYRFYIPGKAVSFRVEAAKGYKEKVSTIAKEIFKEPLKGAVEVRIDYIHPGERNMDMDNISKCIMDALNHVAYEDDKQVRHQMSQEHPLEGLLTISDVPFDVIKPLRDHNVFVVVRIRQV